MLDKESAFGLIDIMTAVKPMGNWASVYDAMSDMSVFKFRQCQTTLEDALKWNVPGLFVGIEDLRRNTLRTQLTTIYEMGCGALLSLALPKMPTGLAHPHAVAPEIPSYITILETGMIGPGNEYGVKISLQHWTTHINRNDYVERSAGAGKRSHFAHKV